MSKVKVDIVTALAEAFGRKLSLPAAKLYVAALSSLSDSQAQAAAGVAMERSKFFPSAAELIELARTQGTSYAAQALVAFEQLEAALDANKPSAMPPLVAAVARQLGSFAELRAMSIADFRTWKRKDFLTAYEQLLQENPERLAAIAGPSSDITKALATRLQRVPSRDEVAAIEDKNRKQLQRLAGGEKCQK